MVLSWTVALCFAAASIAAVPASRQDLEHTLLNKLIGHWVLRGTIGKKTTTHDIEAEWVLNEEYVQIHETSRERDASAKPQYEAIVYVVWDKKLGEYSCLWLDTTGITSFGPSGIGHAKPDGNRILFTFGDRNDGIKTTFAYDDGRDSWSWNIDNLIGGKVSNFARLVLTRH